MKYTKYNKITPEIEKDLDEIADFIVNELKINIFIKCRNRLYPEYRSLFNNIATRKHKISPISISSYYKKRGFSSNYSSVHHSLGKLDGYCRELPELRTYLNMFFKDVEIEKEIIYLENKNLTPIQNLVSELTEEQEKELIEMITLRKKSWAWKTKDNYEIIESH